MTKELGPSVSGYNLPAGRAWETVVFEAGKPVLDRELNLSQDVDGGAAQEGLRGSMPSGWLYDGFLYDTDPAAAVFTPSAVANQLDLVSALKAHVNGWTVTVQHTNATGSNQLDLGAGPAGQGVQRTDVVILEVWRKLISASPDTDGKSPTGLIWQEGNVATDPANDAVLNYPDDILDAALASETTKRVQIQHRLRVLTGVNLATFPYALDDPAAVANSVPPNAATPNGVGTALSYVNQSANGDAGLWRAGDGNPANALGTVDGYMYAIPLMAVFRRNTDAFDRRLNHNGGVASPGPSDRPDGLFHDIVVADDLMDLRMGVTPAGWDHKELLEKTTNALLDNSLRSEFENTSPFGGGNTGTTVLVANEIGISDANGGNGTTTGTTGSGSLAGQFDAVRRRFSDRVIYETVTVTIDPPGGTWMNVSETLTVDPTAMAVFPYPAFNWSSYAPADVRILEVLDMRWRGAPPLNSFIVGNSQINYITGLGAVPIAPITIDMTSIDTGVLTTEPLYVTLLIGYPTGVGLSHTPVDHYGADSFSVNNPGQLPPSPDPVAFNQFVTQDLDYPHREAILEYQTEEITYIAAADATDTFYMPERVETLVNFTVNAVAPANFVNLDDTGRIITFDPPAVVQDEVVVTYHARRPLPQNDEQLTIYFRTAAKQTAREDLLSATLSVVPKVTGEFMYALTAGSGAQGEGYPYATAYVQTGGIFPSNSFTYSGESELSGSVEISVSDFNAETGLFKLPVYVPMVANPDSLTFERDPADIDIEDRTYFKSVPVGYIPNAYSQDLSNPDRHKDVYPIIAELAEDSALGHKGQLVLVLLVRYARFDSTNGVYFQSDLNDNTTTASVFRLKGNLLGKRSN